MSAFFINRNGAPDPVVRDADMVQYIPTVRVAVYEKPRLARMVIERPQEASGAATRERDRRVVERQCLEELSRYYRLNGNTRDEGDGCELLWVRPSLLEEGKLDPDNCSR